MQNEQQENLNRVSEAISPIVMDFYRATLESGEPWHMEELTAYVRERTTVAPDSAGRILRLLRQRGKLDYKVNRSESLYESAPVTSERKPQGSVRPRAAIERHGS